MSAANVSVFDLFKIGIGPSSSHTMGPMTAAHRFVGELQGRLQATARVSITLYGSLALTGKGHATDTAVILGLAGLLPAEVDPDSASKLVEEVRSQRALNLHGAQGIEFDPARDIQWLYKESLPFHPNALTLFAYNQGGEILHQSTFYSVGGGFVLSETEASAPATAESGPAKVPYPFSNAAELLEIADRARVRIADVMLMNECALRPESEVRDGLDRIWAAMEACIERGLRQEGVLPGGLNVKRRAAKLRATLEMRERGGRRDPLIAMDWINAWALAVNEENAAGGKVVTAPTNGAAGVLPAVLRYYHRYCDGTREGARVFLLTAAAVGSLYKVNASISAAEVGCQGEIGVACSMAAAGLAAAQGGSNEQVENAAEIGMEHNLGLTCDPIHGLVQIPCIERNATGAVKAVDAARLALLGDGTHHVTLDRVIETMRRTGADMRDSYKETSLGGLAVNVPEC
ncbi:MAG TPA: L-serine ammonia-lyase [Steroidobacter sp.]|nr:L-serine ammonia-lyase [Steroidobacter sp.]